MHVALGYHWFPSALGYHWERALVALGHQVSYVGLPAAHRPGFDQRIGLTEALSALTPAPDLYLWIDPAGPYFPRGIEDLPIPTVGYLVDVHLGHWREAAAQFFDHVLVSQKSYVDHYRQIVGHDQVHWIPFGAALDVHPPQTQARIYDVGFVGNLTTAHARTARARRLRLLARRFHTNDFFRAYQPAEVAQIYNQSRLAFNTSIAGEVTMRIFESAGCGAMVLTDTAGHGIDDLFDVGKEIVVYRDDADLLSKAEYYLAHEDERAQIAAAGCRRTHAEHQYVHRVRNALEACQRGRLAAPMRQAPASARWAARRAVYTHLHAVDPLFDEMKAMRMHPLRRLWQAAPVLLRRLVR